MYRRYFIVGIVFLFLIGAYFVLFDRDNNTNEYEIYYKKLIDREQYSTILNGLDLNIYENDENGKYIYSIVFDNVVEKENNVKVLILDSNVSNDEIVYFPSFGIIDSIGCSLIPKGLETTSKEKEMLSLSVEYNKKIEYMLIYFNGNNEEQFVKVKVGDYLD